MLRTFIVTGGDKMIEINNYRYKGCLDKKQIDAIIANYESMKNEDLFNMFGKMYYVPVKHLVKKLQEHNILGPKSRVFNNERSAQKEQARQFVLEHYKTMSSKEMAELLDVTTATINNRIRELRTEGLIEEGYCIPPGPKTDYTPIFAKLRAEYDLKTAKEIADELGVERKCVYVAASILIKNNIIRSKKEHWSTKEDYLDMEDDDTYDRLKSAK